MLLGMVLGATAAETNYLSDQPELILSSTQGWGELGRNESAHAAGKPGEPLRIGDRSFSKGLGHHANGAIIVRLDGAFSAFDAEVGLHPSTSAGSVMFRVMVDGTPRFESRVLRTGDAPVAVHVAVAGAKELRLEAAPAGDGISSDMANWGNARLTRGTATAEGAVKMSGEERSVNVAAPVWGTRITATSAYSGAHSAANVADGSVESGHCWMSADDAPLPQILTLALHEPFPLTLIRIRQSQSGGSWYHAKDFRVEGSADGKTFQPLASGTLADSAEAEWTQPLTNGVMRAIRIVILSSFTSVRTCGLGEVELMASLPEDRQPPVTPSFDWSQPPLIPVTVKVQSGSAQLSAGGQTIQFTGELFHLDADQALDAKWTAAEHEFTTFSLDVTARTPSRLRQVQWFAGQWEAGVEQAVQSTALMDNVLFLRKGDMSFFLSLDFPYSRIGTNGITYPPNEPLAAGQHYSAHSLTIGACRLSGQRVGQFDRAEIEAVSAYVERRFPPRIDRPMFLTAGIVNRMTDVREGRIFYSMIDNATIALNPNLIEEDLRLCGKIGVEYYQAFEGVFDWPDEAKTGATMQRLQKEARRLGVKMGDYANPQGLYCPHYNYEHRALNRPEWLIGGADGKPAGPECLGCPEYLKMLRERLVEHNRKYGLKMICLDFLNIHPCYATNHGHEPGDVYQQVLGLVQLMKDLNALDPDFLLWSNSGNWLDLMPKLTWVNPNVYLTDPHARSYASHLNALKFLGDGRREQMVSVHESHFVPYRAFCNCEYYFAPRSRLADTKVFEYSFLQGLAVTPNICPAELRTFLNRIPSKDADHAVAFMQQWLQFIREHFDVWKHTTRIGDAPGVGAAEVYAHIVGDRGFLCLVNQNPFPRTTTLTLDGSIGLSAGETFALNEVYPRECPIAEQPLPAARRGDRITFVMPAQSVRIIEVKAATKAQLPLVSGLPATIKPTKDGYQVVLRAPQGQKVELGLVLPPGQAVDQVSARQTPTVPMYTFVADARVLSQTGNVARIEVQFPRERAPRELTHWRVSPGDVEVDLPTADRTRFLGALVHNAFTEDYEVQLDVRTQASAVTEVRLPATPPAPALTAALPTGERLTYTTKFILPFIEHDFGCNADYSEDPLIELAFADPAQIREIEARLNGVVVPVQRFRNPRQPAYETLFIELPFNVKPGPVELSLNIQYSK